MNGEVNETGSGTTLIVDDVDPLHRRYSLKGCKPIVHMHIMRKRMQDMQKNHVSTSYCGPHA